MSSHRRSHRLSRPLAAGIAAFALAAPAAQAHPAPDSAALPSAHHALAPHGIGQNDPVYWASPDAPIPVEHSRASQVRSTETGFDVTSVAVGAGGLGLIALLAVGGSTLTARRRMGPTA
jgi:hypothetical protein